MVTGGEDTQLVAGVAMGVGEEIDLRGKMNASNVGVLDTGLEIVLQLEVAEEGEEIHFLDVLGLGIVIVGTALLEIIIVMWMIVMKVVGALEIETVLIAAAGTTNMEVVIAMLVTGTHLVETASEAVGIIMNLIVSL